MPTNNPDKIILGFVGDLAAGKGTIAEYLKKKYDCNTYRFSTMLRDVLSRIHVPLTRENIQRVSTILREHFGQDVMSKVIAEDVLQDPKQLVVVEGVRRPSDITYLQELTGFYLIYITADPHIRWERMVKRNENEGDDKKTFEDFLNDEKAEADQLIKEFGAKAVYTITNDGTLEGLYQSMEEILITLAHEHSHQTY